MDMEAMSQAQCAQRMRVARTTVQAIYAGARRKLAECIVNGRPLHIGGGDVHLCEHHDGACGQGCCKWRGANREPEGGSGEIPK